MPSEEYKEVTVRIRGFISVVDPVLRRTKQNLMFSTFQGRELLVHACVSSRTFRQTRFKAT